MLGQTNEFYDVNLECHWTRDQLRTLQGLDIYVIAVKSLEKCEVVQKDHAVGRTPTGSIHGMVHNMDVVVK